MDKLIESLLEGNDVRKCIKEFLSIELKGVSDKLASNGEIASLAKKGDLQALTYKILSIKDSQDYKLTYKQSRRIARELIAKFKAGA